MIEASEVKLFLVLFVSLVFFSLKGYSVIQSPDYELSICWEDVVDRVQHMILEQRNPGVAVNI